MNTIDSTKLIELADADYNMLKEKGKEGEKVLHYNGFLDGFARGLYEGSNPWHKASEELPKVDTHILYIKKTLYGLYYGIIYYPEPPITDEMDWWMEIPELPKED